MESGLVETNGTDLTKQEVGAVSAVAREQSEIQAAIISAKRFPRDESQSFVKAIKSFERLTMAENSQYSFPRGGTTINGPSIDCARELARCWGNIRYGMRIVSMDQEWVHIKGFALDLEANSYVEHEDKFARLVQRKMGGTTQWVKPDERDLRELINRRGAITVRNAILQLIPPDLIDDVIATSNKTLEKYAGGELKSDRDKATKQMVIAFDRIGVNVEMLENKLGHKLDVLTEKELPALTQIYKSIKDGQSTREEHFEFAADTTAKGMNEALTEQVAAVSQKLNKK